MGQQLNKIIKRKRKDAYRERLKARNKAAKAQKKSPENAEKKQK